MKKQFQPGNRCKFLGESRRVKIYPTEGEFESGVAHVESFHENAWACSGLNDCVHGGLDVAADSRGLIYLLALVANDFRVMQSQA
jgi:hypothetical protein